MTSKTWVRLYIKNFQYGWNNIDMLDKIRSSASELLTIFYNKGNMGQTVVEVFSVCEKLIMLSHTLAIVGRKYEQGIVI